MSDMFKKIQEQMMKKYEMNPDQSRRGMDMETIRRILEELNHNPTPGKPGLNPNQKMPGPKPPLGGWPQMPKPAPRPGAPQAPWGTNPMKPNFRDNMPVIKPRPGFKDNMPVFRPDPRMKYM